MDLAEPHLLGVAQKIRSQVAAFASSDIQVDVYALEAGDITKNDRPIWHRGTTRWRRRLSYYLLYHLYMARQTFVADFIYIRYQKSSPLFLYLLRQLKSRHPGVTIVVEVPSYPYHTHDRSLRAQLFNLIDRVSRNFLRLYVDRIVTYSRRDEMFGVKTIRIQNGVDLGRMRNMSPPDDQECLRLLGLANLSIWHGYDRVISGLAAYRDRAHSLPVFFDIVGVGNELPRLREEVRRYGLSDRVCFHGPLHGEELAKVVGRCHVGIACLGMHRVMVDTTDLKSREFCARGLPFMTAHDDPDFPGGLPFVLRIPANDEPVEIESVLRFYRTLRAKMPDFKTDMRQFAEAHLTWEAKLIPVTSYLCGADRTAVGAQ